MNTKFKRVLFDFDGTILLHDAEEGIEEIGKVLKLYGVKRKIFMKQLLHFFNNSEIYYASKIMTYDNYYKTMKYLMPCLGQYHISPKRVCAAIQTVSKNYTLLAPGAKETLIYLKEKGYEICIVTNGFYNEQVDIMKHHGVFEYIDKIYTWDEAYPKPDISFITRVLEGTDPKENVYIGDSPYTDFDMSKAAGIYTIGYNVRKQLASDTLPDIEIQNFTDLKKIL